MLFGLGAEIARVDTIRALADRDAGGLRSSGDTAAAAATGAPPVLLPAEPVDEHAAADRYADDVERCRRRNARANRSDL
jgi:hypothetical protein